VKLIPQSRNSRLAVLGVAVFGTLATAAALVSRHIRRHAGMGPVAAKDMLIAAGWTTEELAGKIHGIDSGLVIPDVLPLFDGHTVRVVVVPWFPRVDVVEVILADGRLVTANDLPGVPPTWRRVELVGNVTEWLAQNPLLPEQRQPED
jgi:hypothetical protein